MIYPLLESSGWALFIGRFHPLLVHLPIGFLFIAVLLEIGRWLGKIDVGASAIRFVLLCSAVGATWACVAGYLLSQGGGYEASLLARHQWQGIGITVFSWLAWMISLIGEKKGRMMGSPKLYGIALGLSVLLTMTAGHDGGSLTHGEGYLTQHLPEPFRALAGLPPQEEIPSADQAVPIKNLQEAVVYKDIVRPIMQARCVQCHNAGKSKGDLRLDELAFIQKGGKTGPVLVAGNSAGSDLMKVCLLPENDDLHMPPKGKPQLTPDQITLLSWWIEQGASGDKKVRELSQSEAVKPALASLSSGNESEKPTVKSFEVLGMAVEPAEGNKIAELRKMGLLVNQIALNSNLLEVSAVNARNFDDRQAAALTGLSGHIVSLKLSGSRISDASLSQIAGLKYLTKLYLDHTKVSDNGVKALTKLGHLEYINLIGTKVTDDALRNLVSMRPMRAVYVWDSNVTDATVQVLSKSNPRVRIVNGIALQDVAGLAQPGKDSVNYSRLIF